RRGSSNVVHLTWQWQRAWWETLGCGELLLIAAERHGQIVALAPFYVVAGMIYLVGSGESSYLDFVGEVDGAGTLEALLTCACDACPGLLGFRFFAVPGNSPTCALVGRAAAHVGLDCYCATEYSAWILDLTDRARATAM